MFQNKEDTKEKQKLNLVQVNMTEKTLRQIEDVRERINAINKTTAIRYSIDIADIITEIISKGGKVILEENGIKYLLKIDGEKK